MKMLVLGTKRFDGEINSQKIKTGKIYTLDDSLNDADNKGFTVGTYNVGYDNVVNYDIVPAYYDVDIKFVASKPVILGCKRISDRVSFAEPVAKNSK